MRRALVIAPNWIGDALMAQPLFCAASMKLHPRMAIDAVAPSWVAPVLERMPEIRDVYATDLAHGKLQMLRRWQLASDLRDVGYDAAYVLPNSLKSALIPWMAGIRLRIGYTGESRIGLLNVRHANPRKDERPPMVGHYAALAYAPGAKIGPRDDPRADAAARRRSERGGARIGALQSRQRGCRSLVFCPRRGIRPREALAAASISRRSRKWSASRSRRRRSSRSVRRKMRRLRRPSPKTRRTCAICAARRRSAKRAR